MEKLKMSRPVWIIIMLEDTLEYLQKKLIFTQMNANLILSKHKKRDTL